MKLVDRLFSQSAFLTRRQEAGLHIIDELQRFRLLVNCLFCSIGVSIVYTFELFTTEFSQRYGLSAGDLSTISTVGVAFCYFVVPYALLFEKTGPAPLLWWGFVCAFIGCLGLNLVFLDIIPGNLAVICVFYAFLNTSAGMFDATSIVTLVETFPRNRGFVVALAKVMTGLGSSVLSSISTNLFGTNISGYLYFVMAFAMVVSLVGSFVLQLPPYIVNWWRRRGKTPAEIEELESLVAVYNTKSVPTRRLALGYVVAITLVVYTAIAAPVVAYVHVSVPAQRLIGSLTVIITCCFFLMLLPVGWLGGVNEPSPSALARAARHGAAPGDDAVALVPVNGKRDSAEAAADDAGDVYVPEKRLRETDVVTAEPVEALSDNIEEVEEEDDDGDVPSSDTGNAPNRFAEYLDKVDMRYTDPVYPGDVWAALKRPDIYLILLGFVLQGAIGVMVMYNAGTIYVATSGEPRSIGVSALYTAFLGVGSALGRIAVGAFEAYVQSQPADRRRFLVTLSLPIPPLVGVVAGILILVLPGEALLFPFILVYFKEGAFYSTCAIVFPALYATHHAIYYNLSSATTVVCVVCFNRFLFGYLVDKKHDALGFAKGVDCTGRECVRLPILVATVLSATAAVTLGIVHWRYKRHVRRTTTRAANANSRDHNDDGDGLDVDAVE